MAVEASKALAAIFHQLLEREPGNAEVALSWARILRDPPLGQVEEGCEVLERAASASGRPGVSQMRSGTTKCSEGGGGREGERSECKSRLWCSPR